MPLFVKRPSSYKRKSSSGVIKVQRDNYSNKKGKWYEHTRNIKQSDGKCLGCGVLAKDTKEGYLVTHHIRELSKGGTTTKRNLITLCVKCHSKRHRHLR